MDPPYYQSETDYGKDVFARSDFTLRANQLLGLKGKFILSLNDHAQVQNLFAAFDVKAVKTNYSISKESPYEVGEVIITNFDIEDSKVDPVLI